MNPAGNDTNPVPIERVNVHIAQQMGVGSFNDDNHLRATGNREW